MKIFKSIIAAVMLTVGLVAVPVAAQATVPPDGSCGTITVSSVVQNGVVKDWSNSFHKQINCPTVDVSHFIPANGRPGQIRLYAWVSPVWQLIGFTQTNVAVNSSTLVRMVNGMGSGDVLMMIGFPASPAPLLASINVKM